LRLSAAADASRLAIHGNIVFAGTAFAVDFVSARVSHSKVYAALAVYAVLATAPPSVLNLP
jgi:hypothetical protein